VNKDKPTNRLFNNEWRIGPDVDRQITLLQHRVVNSWQGGTIADCENGSSLL